MERNLGCVEHTTALTGVAMNFIPETNVTEQKLCTISLAIICINMSLCL